MGRGGGMSFLKYPNQQTSDVLVGVRAIRIVLVYNVSFSLHGLYIFLITYYSFTCLNELYMLCACLNVNCAQ